MCYLNCLYSLVEVVRNIYRVERINCHPRKDGKIPFPFNENRFSFFVADHLLVGQLCTNPQSDWSLLSCPKVTQCSTSKIGDAPLYYSCSLPMCGDPRVQSGGWWQTLGVAAGLNAGPQIQRDPGLASEVLRLSTFLSLLLNFIIPPCI